MPTTRLAVLPNWLGDVVMAEPALRAWRANHHLIAVVEPALAPLVEDCGLADTVEVFDRHGRDRGPAGILACGRRLRRHGACEALVLGPSLRAAALAWASGAEDRRGLGGEGREIFLTEIHRERNARRRTHLADVWLRIACGAEGTGAAAPRWSAGGQGMRRARALSDDLRRGAYVAFAAGARYGSAKQWDAKHFSRCAEILREACGLLPVFVGSASEGERSLAADLAAASGGISIAGRTDLPTLAAVLADAALCVANDSGPMHLASALGTPTVGIFGSTSPAWTAPRGPHARVVGPSPAPCAPCFLRECPYARECFAGTTPALVAETARALLDRVRARAEGSGARG